MTDIQNEKQKRATLNAYHTGIRIEENFPNIERIEIDYIRTHHTAFGPNNVEETKVLTPNSEAFFVIPCINRECSSIGFDMSSEIYEMYRNHQEKMSGEKRCEGQEAPDHPEQPCGSTIFYTIKIHYK